MAGRLLDPVREEGAAAARAGLPLVACRYVSRALLAAWAEGWLMARVSGMSSGGNSFAALHVKPARDGADWLPVEAAALRHARGMTPPLSHAALGALLDRSPRAVAIEASRRGCVRRRVAA